MKSSAGRIQAPKQSRSKKTMDGILHAASEILEEKTFDMLTVAEVVERAGTSVGAFYGRFRDKETLLQALDENFFRSFEERSSQLWAGSRWEGESAALIIEDATRFIVETYSSSRGLLRSLNLKARLNNDIRFREREKKAWDELFPRFKSALLENQKQIQHPDPESAIDMGFQMMFFSAREFLLWEPLRTDKIVSEKALVRQLSRAYRAYLFFSEEEEPE